MGHPFHLQVKLNGWAFLLQDPRQLPALFAYLQVEPIKVPDWLSLSPCLLTEYPSEGIPPTEEKMVEIPMAEPRSELVEWFSLCPTELLFSSFG